MLLGLLVGHSITAYVVREARYLNTFFREVLPLPSFCPRYNVSAKTPGTKSSPRSRTTFLSICWDFGLLTPCPVAHGLSKCGPLQSHYQKPLIHPLAHQLPKNGIADIGSTVQFDKDEGIEAKWMMRFPIPGAVMHPEAKVRHEVAVMEYLKKKTSIRVPKIVAWGTAEENIFPGVGPFIIMEFVDGKPLYDILRGVPIDEVFRERTADEFLKELAQKAAKGHDDNEMLSPDVDDNTLAIIYRQMANVYLELAEHDFEMIGSLSQTSAGTNSNRKVEPKECAHAATKNNSREGSLEQKENAHVSDETSTQEPTVDGADRIDELGSLGRVFDNGMSSWAVDAAPYTNYENEMERCCAVPKEGKRATLCTANHIIWLGFCNNPSSSFSKEAANLTMTPPDRVKPFGSTIEYYMKVAQRKIEAAYIERSIPLGCGWEREVYAGRHLFRALGGCSLAGISLAHARSNP